MINNIWCTEIELKDIDFLDHLCWLITFDVLKFFYTLVYIRIKICWLITLDVLKWNFKHTVGIIKRLINNIRCIEIFLVSFLSSLFVGLINNIRCIEVWTFHYIVKLNIWHCILLEILLKEVLWILLNL